MMQFFCGNKVVLNRLASCALIYGNIVRENCLNFEVIYLFCETFEDLTSPEATQWDTD